MSVTLPPRPMKCGKKNPALCRLHGKAYREYRDLVRSIMEDQKQKEANELHQKIRADIAATSKLKQERDGSWTASVYRSGVPTVPVERKVEKSAYDLADGYAPAGRQSRMTALFASPTLGGVTRWVRGNDDLMPDIRVRELRVNADEVYVYSVRAWEMFRWYEGERFTERHEAQVQAYWASGVPLREWLQQAETDPTLNPEDWELLLPAGQVKSVKPVSDARVVDASYNDGAATDEAFKNTAKNQWRWK